MKNKDLKKIVKVVLIAGIILCGIAQILPWGRLELAITEEIQEEFPMDDLANISINIYFYHWGGMQITPKFPGVPEWYLTPTNFSGITGSSKVYGFAFGTLFGICGGVIDAISGASTRGYYVFNFSNQVFSPKYYLIEDAKILNETE